MKLWNRYRYLGYDKEMIDKVRFFMDKDNIVIVKYVSLLLIVMVLFLLGFYYLFDPNSTRDLICLVAIIFLFLMHLCSLRMLKNEIRITAAKTDWLIDVLSAGCFIAAIYLGTIAAREDMAVAPIWMFFFAILIFNRLPLKNLLVISIASILFIATSYFTKDLYHFQYDVIHGLISIMATLYMSWAKSKMKFEHILAMQTLQNKNLQIMETVEEQVKEANHLRTKVEFDNLSGFYNKEYFENSVTSRITKYPKQRHALICCDIDNFKSVNDTFGHLFGDKALQEIAMTITKEMKESAILGRFGGDEFLFFVQDVENDNDIQFIMDHLVAECTKTYVHENKEINISLSYGIAWYPKAGNNYYELFQSADKLLYRYKRNKKRKTES